MRKLSKLLLLFVICTLWSVSAHAQQNVTASLTTQATACASPPVSGASGYVYVIQNAGNGGGAIAVSGTWSGTLSFFRGVKQSNSTTVIWSALSTTDATPVSTATANGTWQVNTAGYTDICVAFTTASSGTAVVTINLGQASARSNGGTGGGAPSGPAGGSLTGTYPNPGVATLNQNTTGTAANLSGTPALPNGTAATTQAAADNTTKLATDAFVQAGVTGACPIVAGIITCSDPLSVTGSVTATGGVAGTVISGTGASTPALTTPSTPTITPTCASACSSPYDYNIVAKDIYGNRTLRSTSGATSAQNATLGVSNFNTITWSPVAGAYSYDVYIITGGNAPGLIANVLATSTLSVIDNGLPVCYADTPLSNDTNKINLAGNTFAADLSINGVLAGAGPGTCTGQNTRFGGAALGVNTSGYLNSAFGYEALQANTAGYYNTGLGWEALEQNATGHDNTGVGLSTLANNLTGNYNTAVGNDALLNSTGDGSTAVGVSACNATTSGQCTAIGGSAFQSMTTATDNTGVGIQAGEYVTGSYNTAMGDQAMEGSSGSSTGADNSAFGFAALENITSGASNAALGFEAGSNVTTTSDGLYLGYGTQASAATGITNEAAIGYNVTGAGSNKFVIGNSSVTDTYLGGSTSGASNVHANGYYSGATAGLSSSGTLCTATFTSVKGLVTACTATSDIRLKTHIQPVFRGLSDVMKLRPIIYTYNEEGQKINGVGPNDQFEGFSAQNIKSVMPEVVSTEPHDGVDYLSLPQGDRPIVAALVNAIQEQQKEINALKRQVKALRK